MVLNIESTFACSHLLYSTSRLNTARNRLKITIELRTNHLHCHYLGLHKFIFGVLIFSKLFETVHNISQLFVDLFFQRTSRSLRSILLWYDLFQQHARHIHVLLTIPRPTFHLSPSGLRFLGQYRTPAPDLGHSPSYLCPQRTW